MLRPNAIVAFAFCALACASSQPNRIQAPVLVPGANETVAVDQLIVLVDSSSSVDESTLFRDEKAVVESFARSMPEGDYETGSIAFGGFDRTRAPLGEFDRNRVVGEATQVNHLAEGTPIHKAITKPHPARREGRARRGRALQRWHDHRRGGTRARSPARDRRGGEPAPAVRRNGVLPHRADRVRAGRRGASPQALRTAECGTFRTLDGVRDVASLQQFERDVFLEEAALPDVAAAPADLDGDGVLDAEDLCPGTPRGAGIDGRGCWIVKGLFFETNSAQIDTSGQEALDDVANVLRQNPSLRVEIGGHTDAQGSEDSQSGSLEAARGGRAQLSRGRGHRGEPARGEGLRREQPRGRQHHRRGPARQPAHRGRGDRVKSRA